MVACQIGSRDLCLFLFFSCVVAWKLFSLQLLKNSDVRTEGTGVFGFGLGFGFEEATGGMLMLMCAALCLRGKDTSGYDLNQGLDQLLDVESVLRTRIFRINLSLTSFR